MEKALKNIRLCEESGGLMHEGERNYRSCVLDSKENGNVWHRMSISFTRKRGAMFWIRIYTSDDGMLTYKNNSKSIEEVLNMDDGEEKEGFLAKAHVKTCENPSDILLHDVSGRYLWCRIEISTALDVCFDSLTISTPTQSFLSYLPEIFQEDIKNSFADKYLSVFQTIYEDFEREIANSSMLYDTAFAPNALVSEMADWLKIEDKLLWTPKQLRLIVENAHELHKTRGTLRALSLIIEIFLGVKPYFVETFHAMRYYNAFPNLKRLYSNDRFSLWVLVFQRLSDKAEIVLRHLIEKNKPVFTNAHLVMLKPYIIMDSNVYLGINSVVSEYPKVALDGQLMLGYGVIHA